MLVTATRALILAVVFLSFPAHSALITHINNLDIAGTSYDVTIHRNKSYTDLFDADNDGKFGDGDGSVFNRAPTFHKDQVGARQAAQEIMNYLGTTHTTKAGTDKFFVPYSRSTNSINYNAYWDLNKSPSIDRLTKVISQNTSRRTIVTFQLVPTPPTLSLIGLVMIIMGFIGSRRRVYWSSSGSIAKVLLERLQGEAFIR